MGAVTFDTLKLARKLREAGFTAEQAEKTSEALGEAMDGAQIATKADIALVRSDIALVKSDTTNFRSELKSDTTNVKGELRSDIGNLKSDLKSDIALLKADIDLVRAEMASFKNEVKSELGAVRSEFKSDMRELELRMVIKLGAMQIATLGLLLAAQKYLGF